LEDAFKRYAAIVYSDLLILNKADTAVEFCQRCARFRQGSTKLGVPCAFLALLRNSIFAGEGTEMLRSCYLQNGDNFSKTVANNSNFFGGGAPWRDNPTQGASNV
jgi:hypothetical protein